jgi:hypothetical protein
VRRFVPNSSNLDSHSRQLFKCQASLDKLFLEDEKEEKSPIPPTINVLVSTN